MERRKYRLFAGFLYPLIIGFLLIYLPIFVITDNETDKSGALIALIFGVPIALVVMGLPALLFTLLMEYIVNPKISNNILVVIVATTIGALPGSIMGWIGILAGGLAGLLIGLYLRLDYTKTVNK